MSESPFRVRPFSPIDAPHLYAIMQQPDVYANLMQLPSLELSEVEAWAERSRNGRYRFVAEADGKAIGYGSLSQTMRPRRMHSGDVGMYVSRDYWGHGVGSLLMQEMLNFADNWLDLRRIELDVYTDNDAAIRLYEKFGFETEGTKKKIAYGNGRWQDAYLMARLRHVPEPMSEETPSPLRPPQPKATGEVTIRPYHPNDVPDIHQMMTLPSVSRTTLQLPANEESFYAKRSQFTPQGHRLVAEVDGRVIGMITIFVNSKPRMAHSAGLGMSVHPDYWGMGIGSRLMEAILDVADNWLNLKRVELDVNTDNPAGVRLYEKFGFEIEGIKRMHGYGDGRWADSYFMGRIR